MIRGNNIPELPDEIYSACGCIASNRTGKVIELGSPCLSEPKHEMAEKIVLSSSVFAIDIESGEFSKHDC